MCLSQSRSLFDFKWFYLENHDRVFIATPIYKWLHKKLAITDSGMFKVYGRPISHKYAKYCKMRWKMQNIVRWGGVSSDWPYQAIPGRATIGPPLVERVHNMLSIEHSWFGLLCFRLININRSNAPIVMCSEFSNILKSKRFIL